MADNKISVYSLTDLKNTSDDAIPNYLNSLKFKQSHTLTDVRLGLGYAMIVISVACFYWDYKLGFDPTKFYTAIAVGIYTILNAMFTIWVWAVEKGQIYVGTSPAGDKISITSTASKHAPVYNLTITYTLANSSKPVTLQLNPSFTNWFDSTGRFVALPFQKLLASNVPVIGAADPGRATADPAPAVPANAEERIPDDVILQALDSLEPQATGSDLKAAAKKSSKSSKNRKKA